MYRAILWVKWETVWLGQYSDIFSTLWAPPWPERVWGARWWLLRFRSGKPLTRRIPQSSGLRGNHKFWWSFQVCPQLPPQSKADMIIKKKKVLLTWDVCGHIQRGCSAKPFGGGCTNGELVRDPRVELREEVVCGVGGQGHHEARPLEGNRGVKRAKTTVADLLEKKKVNTQW